MAFRPTLDDVFITTIRLGLGEVGAMGLTSSTRDGIFADNSRCPGNCSGHGSCHDGQCLCLVQYSGGTCQEANIGYYIAFGTIFLLLGCVALVQLVVCIAYDYAKGEKRSWRQACHVTVQKLLYLLIICATAIRGAYFFTKWHVSEEVANSLWSAYFPIIVTGFSLIVCFWAEAFHISASPNRAERQFLSKSTIFFITFNVLQYVLLAAQVVVFETIDNHEKKMLVLRVCNGGFALLMFLVVVFFLIYGVEVFFKVQGAFRVSESGLDTWQLQMSRLGVVAQAVLQLITSLFLISDVASDGWKHSLPVLSQNFYDIGFRIVEFGVALWFPCVLWSCGRPEELWVLNPKRIFRSFDFRRRRELFEGKVGEADQVNGQDNDLNYNTFDTESSCSSIKWDCWICYDPDRKDAGRLIQPCKCKGDVATVHHDCLKKWLVESALGESSPECRVCKEKYRLEAYYWIPKGLKPRHWLQTFLVVMLMTGSPIAAYTACHSISSTATYLKVLVIGGAVLLELVAFRLFVLNVRSSCQRIKVATMKISGRTVLPAKHRSQDWPQLQPRPSGVNPHLDPSPQETSVRVGQQPSGTTTTVIVTINESTADRQQGEGQAACFKVIFKDDDQGQGSPVVTIDESTATTTNHGQGAGEQAARFKVFAGDDQGQRSLGVAVDEDEESAQRNKVKDQSRGCRGAAEGDSMVTVAVCDVRCYTIPQKQQTVH